MSNKSVRPNDRRAKWAIVSLYVALAGCVLFALVNVINFYILFKNHSDTPVLLEEWNTLLIAYSVGTILYAITYLICVIFFILWFVRAYQNIQIHLPNSRFRYKPWVAVVSWFIPIWNLFGPYQIATDLFDRTERYLVSEDAMDLTPKYDLVKGTWWGLWIISAIIIRVSHYHLSNFPDSYLLHSTHIIGFLLAGVCALFAVKMIKNYLEMERLLNQLRNGVSSDTIPMANNDLLDTGI